MRGRPCPTAQAPPECASRLQMQPGSRPRGRQGRHSARGDPAGRPALTAWPCVPSAGDPARYAVRQAACAGGRGHRGSCVRFPARMPALCGQRRIARARPRAPRDAACAVLPRRAPYRSRRGGPSRQPTQLPCRGAAPRHALCRIPRPPSPGCCPGLPFAGKAATGRRDLPCPARRRRHSRKSRNRGAEPARCAPGCRAACARSAVSTRILNRRPGIRRCPVPEIRGRPPCRAAGCAGCGSRSARNEK